MLRLRLPIVIIYVLISLYSTSGYPHHVGGHHVITLIRFRNLYETLRKFAITPADVVFILDSSKNTIANYEEALKFIELNTLLLQQLNRDVRIALITVDSIARIQFNGIENDYRATSATFSRVKYKFEYNPDIFEAFLTAHRILRLGQKRRQSTRLIFLVSNRIDDYRRDLADLLESFIYEKIKIFYLSIGLPKQWNVMQFSSGYNYTLHLRNFHVLEDVNYILEDMAKKRLLKKIFDFDHYELM